MIFKLIEETKVKTEYDKLVKAFSTVDPQTFALIEPYLQNLSFMIDTMHSLQHKIHISGATQHTDNGKKVSADLEAYTKLLKQYNDAVNDLLDIVHPQSKKANKKSEQLTDNNANV